MHERCVYKTVLVFQHIRATQILVGGEGKKKLSDVR